MFGVIEYATIPFGVVSTVEFSGSVWIDQCKRPSAWLDQAVQPNATEKCQNAN